MTDPKSDTFFEPLFQSSPICYFSYFGVDLNENTFWVHASRSEVQAERLKQEYPLSGLFLDEGYYWYEAFASPQLVQFYKSHGLANLFFVLQKENEIVETFNFATSLKHPNMINYYLNHLKMINDYIAYFKDKGAHLIDAAKNQKMPIYQNLNVTPKLADTNQESVTKPYIRSTFFNEHLNEWITLTDREKEVLFLSTLQGKTSKEIGEIIGLSPKTIENHIEKLRYKLNAESVRSLLKRAIEIGLIRLQTYF